MMYRMYLLVKEVTTYGNTTAAALDSVTKL